MAGGAGGNGAGNPGAAGGAGGTGFTGNPGNNGGYIQTPRSVGGGGGGGAGGGKGGGQFGGAGGNNGNGAGADTITNTGQLTGGKGGDGDYGHSAIVGGGGGGAGGYGAIVTGNGSSSNTGTIAGGAGGAGGPIGTAFVGGHAGSGGDGGVGVQFTAAGSFNNSGTVAGGKGGNGGPGYSVYAGVGGKGGAGGAGVNFAAGGSFTNSGIVRGGDGGNGTSNGFFNTGGSSLGSGGAGGDGVQFIARGSFTNSGNVSGGKGGNGNFEASGGAGGDGVRFTAGGSLTNSGSVSGGNGGAGGGLASGGNGGVGVQFTASGATFKNTSGTITGGNGGTGGDSHNAGISSGNGGAGGVGVNFSGTGSLTNSGTISGGNGGTAGKNEFGDFGTAGVGGVGVLGGGLTIIDSGTIIGGVSGDGVRADAIQFTGGVNSLTLGPGWNINGNVIAFSAADTLALGGKGRATFDVSQIGANAQYQGFGIFEKIGSSAWTLIGTTTAVTSWAIDDGTLAISSDSNLGNASGTFSFDRGTLQFLAGFTTSRAITLNPGGGTFNTNGNDVTLAGAISGSGRLTKAGAGVLTLSHANAYSGGTTLDRGTLDVAALGAAGTGAIIFSPGHETLEIDNAAFSNNHFANTIVGFGENDVIDLTGLHFGSGASASYNSVTNTLRVSSNGVTDTLTLVAPAGTQFKVVSDGHGGTDIELAGNLSLLSMFSAAAVSDPGSSASIAVATPPSVSSAESPLLSISHV